jgi:septum formation protein
MSAPQLVLASTSPYRRALLERLGIAFRVEAPRCDEEALKEPAKPPTQLALYLAREKALSLLGQEGAFILGSDQLVDFDGLTLGKPHTVAGAVAQLKQLRGRSHQLVTALALVCPNGEIEQHLDLHTLTMRDLSDAEIERYVARERPLDCAGSYKIEGAGIALFERIVGEDFTAITGLPLLKLSGLLRARGFEVP